MSIGADIHLQELRRGTVVLAVLELLGEPCYGYRLLEKLSQRGFAVDANTLYPLLKRLEKQGFLSGEWNTEETRPRKFFRTSEQGQRLSAVMMTEWRSLNLSIETLHEQESSHD